MLFLFRDISLILRTREISIHKHNSCVVPRLIKHSLVLVIVFYMVCASYKSSYMTSCGTPQTYPVLDSEDLMGSLEKIRAESTRNLRGALRNFLILSHSVSAPSISILLYSFYSPVFLYFFILSVPHFCSPFCLCFSTLSTHTVFPYPSPPTLSASQLLSIFLRSCPLISIIHFLCKC